MLPPAMSKVTINYDSQLMAVVTTLLKCYEDTGNDREHLNQLARNMNRWSSGVPGQQSNI